MGDTPTRNGNSTRSIRSQGGYDTFFSKLDETEPAPAASSSWLDTVSRSRAAAAAEEREGPTAVAAETPARPGAPVPNTAAAPAPTVGVVSPAAEPMVEAPAAGPAEVTVVTPLPPLTALLDNLKASPAPAESTDSVESPYPAKRSAPAAPPTPTAPTGAVPPAVAAPGSAVGMPTMRMSMQPTTEPMSGGTPIPLVEPLPAAPEAAPAPGTPTTQPYVTAAQPYSAGYNNPAQAAATQDRAAAAQAHPAAAQAHPAAAQPHPAAAQIYTVQQYQQAYNAAPQQYSGTVAQQPPAGQSGVLNLAPTSPELLAEIAASKQAHLRSTQGMRGALNKVGFSIGLSPAERRVQDRRTRIRRQLTRNYQIAVISVKGGVGRTTTVAALGSTYAELRADRVVAVDANPDFSDLASRTSRHPYGLTLRDLAMAPQLDSFASVQSFASVNSADLAVVASPWSPEAAAPLTGAEYVAGVGILRRHYNLLVIDCGTGVLDSATATVLRTSDAVVVVTPATVRGVTGAVATLRWLDAHGLSQQLEASMVAIVHQHPARPTVDVDKIEELFTAAQRPTRTLPYDPHLAEGGEIDLRLLQEETAVAFEELAAALADRFPSHPAATAYTDRGVHR